MEALNLCGIGLPPFLFTGTKLTTINSTCYHLELFSFQQVLVIIIFLSTYFTRTHFRIRLDFQTSFESLSSFGTKQVEKKKASQINDQPLASLLAYCSRVALQHCSLPLYQCSNVNQYVQFLFRFYPVIGRFFFIVYSFVHFLFIATNSSNFPF
jgi:uncharacterized membrane protein